MLLKLMTQRSLVEEREVYSVTVPVKGGQMTVMDDHDILASLLDAGEVFFRESEGSERIAYTIDGGGLEVTGHSALIFTGRAERVH